jgi:hypothetical protein
MLDAVGGKALVAIDESAGRVCCFAVKAGSPRSQQVAWTPLGFDENRANTLVVADCVLPVRSECRSCSCQS